MPALDFPSSPTNGQKYGNYIYDSSITAWRNVNSETGVAALNTMGLRNVVPTSVTVSSGSATTSANGLVTYSGAGTITLNDVFSSTYTNYLIAYDFSNFSQSTSFYHRYTLSGTPQTGSDYATFAAKASSTAGTNSLVFDGTGTGATQSWMGPVYAGAYGRQGGMLTVKYPAQAKATTSFLQTMIDNSSGTVGYLTVGGYHNVSTAWNGIQFYPTLGNASGTIQVYGYTN